MIDLFNREIPETLIVKARPGASYDRVKVEYSEDGIPLFKIYVTAPPEDGKANESIIKLLSKRFGLPKSAFTITKGLTGRDKVVKITKLE